MPNRPNILQITTHDSGRHLGCYGHPTLHTPILDQFAGEGVRLTNYFAAVPICCASRATQLTGLWPQRHGLLDLCFPPFDWRLRDGVLHLSQRLRRAGYRTALCGTQHEVVAAELDRLEFDRILAPRHLPADGVAAEAAGFLRSQAAGAQPFYAQIGFFETHTPFDFGGVEPDTSLGVEVPPYLVDDAPAQRAMAGYQGAIRKVDAAVAVMLEALRESGLEEQTLVVFTTDHGIELPRSKWFCYDPGLGISMLVRWPGGGLDGGRDCDLLLSNVDYVPTILELAGLELEPDPDLDGRSFADALRTGSTTPVRDAAFAMYHKTQSRAVRTGRFKLIRHFDAATDFRRVPVRIEDAMMKRGSTLVELYDLDEDPNEFTNVAGQPAYADTQRQLANRLWDWLERVDDPLLHGPIRTPSYEKSIADHARWRAGTTRS